MSQPIAETLTLWYPITLAPGLTIQLGADSPMTFSVGSRSVELTVEGREVVFVVRGIVDRVEAETWLSRLRRACLWAMLQCQTSFVAETSLDEVTFYENWREERDRPRTIVGKEYPEGLDGLADFSKPHLFPDGARLARFKMGTPSLELGTPGGRFVAEVARGAALSPNGSLPERLETALALFAAADHEVSASARFLTRVMALEAMVIPRLKHDAVVGMVERWVAEIGERLAADPSDGERASLLSLQGQVAYLREESIKSGIRALVLQSLARSDPANAEAEEREASRLYDARSRLVHDGALRSDALAWAHEASIRICKAVLASCLEHGPPVADANPALSPHSD